MMKMKSLIAGLVAGALCFAHAQAQVQQLGAGQVLANPGAAQARAIPSSVTAVLDRALGATRGAILERGSAGWAIVGPGSSAGLPWVSNGAGADPAYQLVAATGGGTNNAFFQVSGPAGSIKTYVFPNANSTMAAINQIQTWTGAQSFSDGDLILLGASSGSTTLHAPATGGVSATFFAGTDTVTGIAAAQTLTNKTINCANNTCGVRLGNDISGFGTGEAASLANAINAAGAPVVPTAALTANGVVIGGGSGVTPTTAAAMTDGQLLVGQTGAAPLPKTISGSCTLAASGAISCTSSGRTMLIANAIYFVNGSTGSDSNNCTASGTACLTIQGVYNKVLALDFNGFNVTVNIADGTYSAAGTVLSIIAPQLGGGTLSFVGNTTTPANVIINSTGDNTVSVSNNAVVSFDGMEVRSSTAYAMKAVTGAVINANLGHYRAGAAGAGKFFASQGARINVGTLTDVGNATEFALVQDGGSYINLNSATITYSGTPSYSSGYVIANNLGEITAAAMTFSPATSAFTGARFTCTANSVVNTGSGSSTYFPGSAVGTTATGCQYL